MPYTTEKRAPKADGYTDGFSYVKCWNGYGGFYWLPGGKAEAIAEFRKLSIPLGIVASSVPTGLRGIAGISYAEIGTRVWNAGSRRWVLHQTDSVSEESVFRSFDSVNALALNGNNGTTCFGPFPEDTCRDYLPVVLEVVDATGFGADYHGFAFHAPIAGTKLFDANEIQAIVFETMPNSESYLTIDGLSNRKLSDIRPGTTPADDKLVSQVINDNQYQCVFYGVKPDGNWYNVNENLTQSRPNPTKVVWPSDTEVGIVARLQFHNADPSIDTEPRTYRAMISGTEGDLSYFGSHLGPYIPLIGTSDVRVRTYYGLDTNDDEIWADDIIVSAGSLTTPVVKAPDEPDAPSNLQVYDVSSSRSIRSLKNTPERFDLLTTETVWNHGISIRWEPGFITADRYVVFVSEDRPKATVRIYRRVSLPVIGDYYDYTEEPGDGNLANVRTVVSHGGAVTMFAPGGTTFHVFVRGESGSKFSPVIGRSVSATYTLALYGPEDPLASYEAYAPILFEGEQLL